MTSPRLPIAGSAAGPRPTLSPETLAAKELCGLLSKTAKATRIYARNNDIYLRFWKELVANMSRYLEDCGRLSLQVDSTRITMDGNIVYELDTREDNFAFRLYKDGIRRLDFVQGLTENELETFMDIITIDFDRGDAMDRDVVSLIWEADFKHIQTLSVDSFAEEDLSEAGEGEEAEDIDERTLIEQETEALAQALEKSAELKLLRLDAEERETYRDVSSGSAAFEERSALDEGAIFQIDAAERERIRQEVEGSREDEIPMERVAELIFELFRQETPDEFGELTTVLLGAMDVLLAEGALETANKILFPLKMLSSEHYARAFTHHKQVEKLFHRLGQPQRLEYLKVSLNDGRLEGGPRALFGFLSVQLPENVPGILEWMEGIKDDELRRAAVDALITVSRDNLKPFHDVVRTGSAQLLADVIHGMGRIGDVHSLEVILGAFAHSDPVVREEVLVALRSFESPRAREIMLSALNDPVEQVRMAALRYVAVRRDRLAGQLLVEKINGRTFRNRSFAEKRAIFMALAHIRGREALPLLRAQLKQRNAEVRRAVVHGLGVVGGAEARRMLEPLARGKDAEMAAECRQLLGKMR